MILARIVDELARWFDLGCTWTSALPDMQLHTITKGTQHLRAIVDIPDIAQIDVLQIMFHF